MGETRRINLALQGGGAHGAFTWGVLDRLLADEDIEVAGISGTSAGALNGAALKSGWVVGGREGAREMLDWFWSQVSGVRAEDLARWMWPASPATISRSLEYSLPYAVGDSLTRVLSPYAWGPFYRNPLESIVRKFDFDCVCAADGPQFFVCATRVRNGKIRVFTGEELSSDVIMASACLPTLFQAVEIDEAQTGRREGFWDGGYTGNPALFPLFSQSLPEDIVVVNINPLEREEVPVSPQQIQNRINEISFNSSLLKELRAIDFVDRLIRQGKLSPDDYRQVRVHIVESHDELMSLGASSKMNVEWEFLTKLRDLGRAAMTRWLDENFEFVGKRNTVDVRAMFQGIGAEHQG